MLFSFILLLSSSTEIFSGLESVFFSLITTSTLTDQVSLPHSIMLLTHAEYMSFAPKGKFLLAKKGTKSFELTSSTPDLCYNTIYCTPCSSYCVTKIKHFHNFSRLAI